MTAGAEIVAPDGSVWGFGRVGPAEGRPVLVHHGLIGDATMHPAMAELGEAHDLEWIILERPGYGRTKPRPMERLADWPGLAEPVLAALGVAGRFDVLGTSAGAPCAYAMAAGLPDRVGRVAILSGVPFLHEPGVLAAYPAEGRAAYARYRVAGDDELRAEFRDFCEAMAERFSEERDMGAPLRAVLGHDAAGPAREARLQAVDWGFGAADIRCPVDIWHSEQDDMVPYGAARLSARALPEATWHIQAEPSHLASDATLHAMAARLGGASG